MRIQEALDKRMFEEALQSAAELVGTAETMDDEELLQLTKVLERIWAGAADPLVTVQLLICLRQLPPGGDRLQRRVRHLERCFRRSIGPAPEQEVERLDRDDWYAMSAAEQSRHQSALAHNERQRRAASARRLLQRIEDQDIFSQVLAELRRRPKMHDDTPEARSIAQQLQTKP